MYAHNAYLAHRQQTAPYPRHRGLGASGALDDLVAVATLALVAAWLLAHPVAAALLVGVAAMLALPVAVPALAIRLVVAYDRRRPLRPRARTRALVDRALAYGRGVATR